MNVSKIGAVSPLNLTSKQILPFKGQENTDEGSAPKEEKKRSLTAKKWGVGIASYLFPGLGQLINGQFGRACGFYFTSLGFGALFIAGLVKSKNLINYTESEKAVEKNTNKISGKLNFSKNSSSKGALALLAIGLIGAIATNIYGIVDAVKQTKRDRV